MNQKYLALVAEAMEIAYGKQHENSPIQEIDMPWGLDGCVIQLEGYPILCLEGSNEFTDWIFNLLAIPWNGYHLGFWLSFKNAWPKIFSYLEPLIKDDRIVLIGGFSNGAAIAYHCAVNLSFNGFNTYLYTWGQPKVRTQKRKWDKMLLKEYLRFYHPRDLITKVPPYPFVHHPSLDPGVEKNWDGWPHNLKKYLYESFTSLD